ncbi:MAG: glycoside hydrolase family 127 protein [Candidatus Hydrogenedentes bacterium]|nr:glycoside hydrolase family 127 protein [Candidatus Hydrogenedentota bacterium]
MRICVVFFFIITTFGASGSELLEQVPLDSVKVEGEIGRRILITIYNNSMVMDIDKDFLKPFREKNACGDYVGLGKTIDAFVRFAKYTNDPKVSEKKDYIVKSTLAIQEDDGYIGFFRPECRVWHLWDIHEMSYIISGLLSEHKFYGNERALSAAKKAGDYLIEKMSPYPGRIPGEGDVCWEMGTTGVEDAMLGLYEISKDEKFITFVRDYMGLPKWDEPIVKGRWGNIKGHAYAHIKRCMAKIRLHRIEPDDSLLVPSKKVIDFMLKGNGLVITGTCGQHECWHDTHEGIANLGETCTTAYLIRWWGELLRSTRDSRYGDLIERAMYNSLFGAQSPDGRKIRYYTPFEGERVYFDRDSYCCPCNYRRIIAELPQMIYYFSERGIYVNLYTQSRVSFDYQGAKVSIFQETKYPSNGNVKIGLDISEPKKFSLYLRIPLWCREYRLRVNDEAWESPGKQGNWVEINREWKSGDIVELELGMRLRFIRGVQAQAGRCAIMYGPMVFCMSIVKNSYLKEVPVRAITIDLRTVEGPFEDSSMREGGLMLKAKGWKTTSWYPLTGYDYNDLVLTEFPDPDGVLTYFHIPNPEDPLLETDEFHGLDLPVK